WLVEALLARPDKSLDLLPGGKAHAAKLTELAIGSGVARQTLSLWSITGGGTSPLPGWAGASNTFFALTLRLPPLPHAHAGEQSASGREQASAMAAQAPALAKSLVTVPAGPVAFTGVRLFDADTPRFLNDQTVIVDKGVISAVGPREAINVPRGAQAIEGHG